MAIESDLECWARGSILQIIFLSTKGDNTPLTTYFPIPFAVSEKIIHTLQVDELPLQFRAVHLTRVAGLWASYQRWQVASGWRWNISVKPAAPLVGQPGQRLHWNRWCPCSGLHLHCLVHALNKRLIGRTALPAQNQTNTQSYKPQMKDCWKRRLAFVFIKTVAWSDCISSGRPNSMKASRKAYR